MQYSIQQEYPWRAFNRSDITRLLNAVLSLLLFSVVAMVIWRYEIDYHGWNSLAWIHYFHWAIPVGGALFVVWLFVYLPLNKPYKLSFTIATAIAMVPLYWLAKDALEGAYAQRWYFGEPGLDYYFQRFAIIPCYVGIPLLFWGAAKWAGVQVNWVGRTAGAVCYFGGPLLSVVLLEFMQHRGSADFIHAIKSGYLIPFVILGLGLPVALVRRNVDADQA